MKLSSYDIVIVNSSGGKDSLVALYEICRMADEQGYSKEQIIVSHQDLGLMEWPGTKELVKKQADHFGLRVVFSKYQDEYGKELTLLEYVKKRGKWPSRNQRWCTSDFKRGPGSTVITEHTKELMDSRVLYVFGFRKSESPTRKKKKRISVSKRHSRLSAHGSRIVREYLPIHSYSDRKVWQIIRDNDLPYAKPYDLGVPRYSCRFCFFMGFDALVLSGIHNPELLDEYVEVEDITGHSFRQDFTIKSVREAIAAGYVPKRVANWTM